MSVELCEYREYVKGIESVEDFNTFITYGTAPEEFQLLLENLREAWINFWELIYD